LQINVQKLGDAIVSKLMERVKVNAEVGRRKVENWRNTLIHSS